MGLCRNLAAVAWATKVELMSPSLNCGQRPKRREGDNERAERGGAAAYAEGPRTSLLKMR